MLRPVASAGVGVLVLAGVAAYLATRKGPTPVASATHRPSSGSVHHRQPPSTTTIPPGDLPQTKAFPSTTDPAFLARMRDLVRAAALDRPALAMGAFFPLGAYVQVKAISDPVADWHHRLIANYRSDIGLVHEQMGPEASLARFVSVSVPDTAIWVLPGVEYNKGSYWRVYDSTVTYREGTVTGTFTVTSMISWRGEWYVVHLGVIR